MITDKELKEAYNKIIKAGVKPEDFKDFVAEAYRRYEQLSKEKEANKEVKK